MKTKLKNKKAVIKEKLTLENFNIPSYKEIREKIASVVGDKLQTPLELGSGIWSEQAMKVLTERYLRKDKDGNVVETPEEMCWRVSWEVASSEALQGKTKEEIVDTAKTFYQLLVSRKFLPNSPTLMNAGTFNNLQYSACFVLPVGDSLIDIFDAIKYQAIIHQTGGGTGFAFSRLRAKGSLVKSSNGVASGPISFMKVFDAATNEIKQGGRRRGANMGMLRVDHPDIMEFIHCKEDGGITNFNISVSLTNAFMKAYYEDKDYDLIDPRTGSVVGQLSAKKVFDEIADGAWRTGDPGLVFIDRANEGTANPVPTLGPVEATNPCGEQPLYPYDACNLGSIFLTYFVKEVNGKKEVDWDGLRSVARMAVRFLDDVIDVNPFPLEMIRKTVLGIRRIGLGVGGWSDMLVNLGIPYDSEEAMELAAKVMKTIEEEAVSASQDLAKVRGAFPFFEQSIYKTKTPRRNSTVTTIAPTGSISIIANASSGIEPLFAIAYQHIVKDKHLDRTLTFFNPDFEKMMIDRGLWNEDIKKKVSEHGTIRDIEGIPDDIKAIFGTAHEITPDWHIKTQAAFQKYTENAVSKTINLSHDATVEDIKRAYLLSWETGCKGITVFRDGCKNMQVLNLGIKNGEEKKEEVKQVPANETWLRPLALKGSTYKIKTPVGTAFITVNEDENDNPIEVFINIGRAGSDIQAMAEALGRLISKSLKFTSNLTPKERAMIIIDQLKGIGGRRAVGFGPNRILSLPDAIAIALSNHMGLKFNHSEETVVAPTNGNGKLHAEDFASAIKSEAIVTDENYQQLTLDNKVGDICPSCGSSSFVYEEGCSKCHACGHSEC